MDVKDAVERAKAYVLELFGADGLTGLRLEEIERRDGIWNVTVGFMRPLELASSSSQYAGRADNIFGARVFRVVQVNDADGEVLSVKIRELLG